jgi:hypothetical protein
MLRFIYFKIARESRLTVAENQLDWRINDFVKEFNRISIGRLSKSDTQISSSGTREHASDSQERHTAAIV